MESFFRALADRTRLRLLNLLGDKEVCVCFLVEVLKTTQPNVSRHLAYLRRAGIVGARRDGKWMHYKILAPRDSQAAGVLHQIRSWIALDPDMERDRRRLARVCCSPSPPVQFRAAPTPQQSLTGPTATWEAQTGR